MLLQCINYEIQQVSGGWGFGAVFCYCKIFIFGLDFGGVKIFGFGWKLEQWFGCSGCNTDNMKLNKAKMLGICF